MGCSVANAAQSINKWLTTCRKAVEFVPVDAARRPLVRPTGKATSHPAVASTTINPEHPINQQPEDHRPLLAAVGSFMQTAGQSVGRFNARQACLYTGLQLEELGEKIDAIIGGCLTPEQRAHLLPLSDTLRHYSAEFKAGLHEGSITRANHADLIDADFDAAWVSLGSLMSISAAPTNAVAHGIFTNLAKFTQPDGTFAALRDENGKVKKPPGWTPPNFEPYVDPLPRV